MSLRPSAGLPRAPGLGERGYARWQAMATTDVPRNALVLAAPRTADRLDELDNIIQGKGVLNLMQFRALDREVDDDGSVNINVEVKFNAAMAEARQHAVAFSNILTKLSPADSKAAAAPAPVPTNLPSNVSPFQRLTQSNPYKVVRPGSFDYNQPDLRRIVMLQGDRRQSGSPADGVIARDQIARVLIDSRKIDAADHKTLELIADHGREPDDLTPVFTALAPDSDGSPDAAKDIVGLARHVP